MLRLPWSARSRLDVPTLITCDQTVQTFVFGVGGAQSWGGGLVAARFSQVCCETSETMSDALWYGSLQWAGALRC